MVPRPGESPGDWWAATDHRYTVLPTASPLSSWPDVPTRPLQARDDRFFPVESQRRVPQHRLGSTPDEMPGGHLVALSRPKGLAGRLQASWAETRSVSRPWRRHAVPTLPAVSYT